MKNQDSIQAFGLLEELRFYVKSQNILFIEIGRVLKSLRDTDAYRTLGHESWTAFLASGELSIKPSTAYAYIEIYETFIEKLKVNKEELSEIPYDKLRLALPTARRIEEGNTIETEELVLKTKELSRSDLMIEFGQMQEYDHLKGKTVYMVQCQTCKNLIKPMEIELCLGH